MLKKKKHLEGCLQSKLLIIWYV